MEGEIHGEKAPSVDLYYYGMGGGLLLMGRISMDIVFRPWISRIHGPLAINALAAEISFWGTSITNPLGYYFEAIRRTLLLQPRYKINREQPVGVM